MSRNLATSDCPQCKCAVVLEEAPRPITTGECGGYTAQFYGCLTVANAHCPSCLSQFLAWLRQVPPGPSTLGTRAPQLSARQREALVQGNGREPFDLSYRSTFTDEPGALDEPLYATRRRARDGRVVRVGWAECRYASYDVAAHPWMSRELEVFSARQAAELASELVRLKDAPVGRRTPEERFYDDNQDLYLICMLIESIIPPGNIDGAGLQKDTNPGLFFAMLHIPPDVRAVVPNADYVLLIPPGSEVPYLYQSDARETLLPNRWRLVAWST